MTLTAETIAQHLGGKVTGDPGLALHGISPANAARSGDLTFAENPTYFTKAEQSEASAILVDQEFKSDKKTLIHVPNSRVAFAQVLDLFFPEPQYPAGVHPTSVVSEKATVDPSAHIGPHCVVGDDCEIGPDVVLQSHIAVGPGSKIDAGSNLFPNVTLYARTQVGQRVRIHSGTVVGADGFGYVLDNGVHRKIPQTGNVVIHDDVEIGANVTIDRATLGSTVIGKGTKIDNLVQIAHNVVIGEHSIIVAQVGVAGSTRMGNYVTLGGQVGIAGHLKIGDRVMVAAQSGVMHDIPSGEKWFGAPAQPDRISKRQLLAVQKLPGLIRRIADLEAQLRKPENRDSQKG